MSFNINYSKPSVFNFGIRISELLKKKFTLVSIITLDCFKS